MNRFADRLAPGRPALPLIHPHRTIVFGNWGIHVLELALAQEGKEVQWHDSRNEDIDAKKLRACHFVIVNISTREMFNAWIGGRHWLGLKCIDGVWFNLDSKLEQPIPVRGTSCNAPPGSLDAVQEFLKMLQNDKDATILFVV